MSNLLSANFMRLKKNKLFWAELILMAALGIFFPVKIYRDDVQMGYIHSIDNGFFACTLFLGVIIAVFCGLFIGTEYSDGTIRNKIIVGQRRSTIYLANFILSSVVGIVLCIAFFVPYLCVGIPLLGFFTADMRIILLTGFTVLLLAVAYSSIFTFIAMLCQSKSVANVICILFAFGFLLAGSILDNMLQAPETITPYILSVDGTLVSTEEPNPKYLDGTKREIVQTIYDILPGGQTLQCAVMATVNLPRLPFYSLAIVLIATGGGCALFQKRDLR